MNILFVEKNFKWNCTASVYLIFTELEIKLKNYLFKFNLPILLIIMKLHTASRSVDSSCMKNVSIVNDLLSSRGRRVGIQRKLDIDGYSFRRRS